MRLFRCVRQLVPISLRIYWKAVYAWLTAAPLFPNRPLCYNILNNIIRLLLIVINQTLAEYISVWTSCCSPWSYWCCRSFSQPWDLSLSLKPYKVNYQNCKNISVAKFLIFCNFTEAETNISSDKVSNLNNRSTGSKDSVESQGSKKEKGRSPFKVIGGILRLRLFPMKSCLTKSTLFPRNCHSHHYHHHCCHAFLYYMKIKGRFLFIIIIVISVILIVSIVIGHLYGAAHSAKQVSGTLCAAYMMLSVI